MPIRIARLMLQVALFSLVATATIAEAKLPNIVLILTDDQGWGDIASHGNDKIDTPVLDRLAKQGARFDRFYVSPLCAPTRASVLTGRYHLRTGTTWVTGRREVMRAEEVTIAEVLKEAGYATGCFGKWHNGAHFPYHPNGQGFDEFFGFCGGHWNNYVNPVLENNGTPVKTKGYITDVITDAVVRFIEKQKDGPFFAFVPYNAPHAPFQTPSELYEKYKRRKGGDRTAHVYAMVENIDMNVGRILSALDEHQIADQTVVIFLTDNGPNGQRFNGGMKGSKGSNDEGGMRVPCFVRWPGQIKPGTIVKPIAAHIDLLPTIAAICKIEKPKTKPLDGRNLVPLLTGKSPVWPDRNLYDVGTVRTQQYRLKVKRGRTQLFDMLADPGQKNNIASEHPALVKELSSKYRQWYTDVSKGKAGMPPPIPVGYAEAPRVELFAPDGKPTKGLTYNRKQGWANSWLINWNNPKAAVTWSIDVVRAGTYQISLKYTCSKEDIGSTIKVQTGKQTIEAKVDKPFNPPERTKADGYAGEGDAEKDWAVLSLGKVALQEGKQEITLSTVDIAAKEVFHLKSVVLERID